VMGLMLMLHTGARATALGLLLAATLAALALGSPGRRFAGGFVRALAVAVGLWALLFYALPWTLGVELPWSKALRADNLMTDSSRGLLWHKAWEQIRGAPGWGIGPMHFASAAQANPVAAHPHNLSLQLAAEWGLPLALLAFGLVGRALWRLARAVRLAATTSTALTRDAASEMAGVPIGVALLISLVAAAVDAQFSGNLVMPGSQLWLALSAGWALAWFRAQRALTAGGPSQPFGQASLPAWPLALCLSGLLVWASGQAWQDLQQLDEMLKATAEKVPGMGAMPRFWSNGWF